jgi:hypothetical protein
MKLQKEELLSNYRENTNYSAEETLNFIFKNRHQIVKDFSYNTLKEMILNYRTYFRKEQKTKIINDYLKYIINKTDHHKSDLAIGYNIIKNVFVDPTSEKIIIDFMFNRLKDRLLLKYKKIDLLSENHFMKKHLVMNYIDDEILAKKK